MKIYWLLMLLILFVLTGCGDEFHRIATEKVSKIEFVIEYGRPEATAEDIIATVTNPQDIKRIQEAMKHAEKWDVPTQILMDYRIKAYTSCGEVIKLNLNWHASTRNISLERPYWPEDDRPPLSGKCPQLFEVLVELGILSDKEPEMPSLPPDWQKRYFDDPNNMPLMAR